MKDIYNNEVILQTFDWNTAVNEKNSFYKNLLQHVDEISKAGFTAVWFPPPWKDSSANAVGYFWQDFSKTTVYGSDDELKKVAAEFKQAGIKVIYDLVLNHRNMGAEATGIWQTIPLEVQRANLSYKIQHHFDIFDNGNNDLNLNDHRILNAFVEEMVNLINHYSAGGFRFDFAKGYEPHVPKRLIAMIEKKFKKNQTPLPPLFLVGEYWDENQDIIKKVWADSSDCLAFDFPLQAQLKESQLNNRGVKKALNANPSPDWREIAVTFVDNHDTGYSEEKPGHVYVHYDPFKKNLFVPQTLRQRAYAYILLTPGTPCVYWPHWETWGALDGLKGLIHDLIRIRKVIGLSPTSSIQLNPAIEEEGILATVKGDNAQMTLGIYNGDRRFDLPNINVSQNTYIARQGWGFIQCENQSQLSSLLDECSSFDRLSVKYRDPLEKFNLFSVNPSYDRQAITEDVISDQYSVKGC